VNIQYEVDDYELGLVVLNVDWKDENEDEKYVNEYLYK
jgi:hypothetical protein